jgi:hypothetical protein
MTLSWNEIKDRALKFSKEWAGTANEDADAKPFLVEFFNVFGISSKRVSTFEYRVKKLDDKDGYIDLLWKGTVLIEMKSRGKNLDKAYEQAIEYTHGLKEHELPKYILVSNFENFRLYDLSDGTTVEFQLNDLVKNVQHFGYLLGYQKKQYKEQDPANIKASRTNGQAARPTGRNRLHRASVRSLFGACFVFAFCRRHHHFQQATISRIH